MPFQYAGNLYFLCGKIFLSMLMNVAVVELCMVKNGLEADIGVPSRQICIYKIILKYQNLIDKKNSIQYKYNKFKITDLLIIISFIKYKIDYF